MTAESLTYGCKRVMDELGVELKKKGLEESVISVIDNKARGHD